MRGGPPVCCGPVPQAYTVVPGHGERGVNSSNTNTSRCPSEVNVSVSVPLPVLPPRESPQPQQQHHSHNRGAGATTATMGVTPAGRGGNSVARHTAGNMASSCAPAAGTVLSHSNNNGTMSADNTASVGMATTTAAPLAVTAAVGSGASSPQHHPTTQGTRPAASNNAVAAAEAHTPNGAYTSVTGLLANREQGLYQRGSGGGSSGSHSLSSSPLSPDSDSAGSGVHMHMQHTRMGMDSVVGEALLHLAGEGGGSHHHAATHAVLSPSSAGTFQDEVLDPHDSATNSEHERHSADAHFLDLCDALAGSQGDNIAALLHGPLVTMHHTAADPLGPGGMVVGLDDEQRHHLHLLGCDSNPFASLHSLAVSAHGMAGAGANARAGAGAGAGASSSDPDDAVQQLEELGSFEGSYHQDTAGMFALFCGRGLGTVPHFCRFPLLFSVHFFFWLKRRQRNVGWYVR